MVDFNPKTEIVLRNVTTSFKDIPEDKKVKIDDQIKIDFKNATVTSKEKLYQGEPENEGRTTYYDTSGNELGYVTIWHDTNGVHKLVYTQNATYYDMDNNGTIDSMVTEKIYKRKDIPWLQPDSKEEMNPLEKSE